MIEFAAACIAVWQFRGEDRETRAVRLIGVTFFALALYLVIQSIRSAATLLGTGLNAWLGWWWADPAAARSELSALSAAVPILARQTYQAR